MASWGGQVGGAAGYVWVAGGAQVLREGRVGPLDEGTSGIQALDFVTRKVLRDRRAGG